MALSKNQKCACGRAISRGTKTKTCLICFNRQREERRRPPDSFTVRGDTAEVSRLVSEPVHSLAALVRVCQIDLTEWRVHEHTCNVWEGFAKFGKPGDERIVQPQMFQVKALLKRKTEIIDARAEIAALLADAKDQMGQLERLTYAHDCELLTNGIYMLELHIPDPHIGKLAWAMETGHENYDTKIAVRVYRDAIEALIARTAVYTFDQIVLVIGNDMLNADTKANTTTAGTPQDTDSRYQKAFIAARRLMVDVVLRLMEIAPVRVYVVPGNHDTLAAWHLGDSLECRFHDSPRVTIHNEPTMRKYHQFGKVMLMFTHGNKGKLSDYPLLMATEQHEMFGATLFREAHTGDKHHLRVQEHHGVRVRISPALCAPDAWHSENHYVGAQRAAEAFIWSADEGLVGTAVYTVPAEKAA